MYYGGVFRWWSNSGVLQSLLCFTAVMSKGGLYETMHVMIIRMRGLVSLIFLSYIGKIYLILESTQMKTQKEERGRIILQGWKHFALKPAWFCRFATTGRQKIGARTLVLSMLCLDSFPTGALEAKLYIRLHTCSVCHFYILVSLYTDSICTAWQ